MIWRARRPILGAMHAPLSSTLLAAALTALAPAPAQDPVAPPPPPAAVDEDEFRAQQERRYFELCDHDHDGVLVFRELAYSLGLDREGFRAYDTDGDGRVDRDEFGRRFREVIDLVGGFEPPRARTENALPSERTVAEILAAYDADRDRALDRTEVSRLLDDVGVVLPPATLFALDADGSGRLELGELAPAVARLEPNALLGLFASGGSEPLTLDALFGQQVERDSDVSLPPRIVGPVTHFSRLDHDHDGSVSERDLLDLQRPLRVAVRARSVIAALDTNRDGVLSEDEFVGALE